MLISDPDNNSDENLAALAKKFEEKYVRNYMYSTATKIMQNHY